MQRVTPSKSTLFFVTVKSTDTKEEKRVWHAWEKWEIRNIRCQIDAWLNAVIYHHYRWEKGKSTIMKRHPKAIWTKSAKGNGNIYSLNEIGSEWERLTVMHRADTRSWTARSWNVPVILSRLSRLANGELVRSRDRPTSCTRCCATLLSSPELWWLIDNRFHMIRTVRCRYAKRP